MQKNSRKLSDDQLEMLKVDYLVRRHIQSVMSQNTKVVIEIETGIDPTTMWHIDKGQYDARRSHTVSPERVEEAKRRRLIWRIAKEQYNDYTLPVLSKKYGVTATSLSRHFVQFRDQENACRRLAA